MSVSSSPEVGRPELVTADRSSVVTLVSVAVSASMGFALVFLLARLLGAAGSGVALQAVAFFSITMSITRLGSDTTAMWLLPRLRQDDRGKIPVGLSVVLIPPIVVTSAVALGWVLAVYERRRRGQIG